MNKKRNIILLLILFLLTFSIGIGTIATIKADNTLDNIDSEYKVGSEIKLPDYYFEEGSNKVKASKTIICPNGAEYRTDVFTPEVMGKYTVSYSALVGGKYKVEERSFYAYSDLYEVSKGSSIFYGTNHVTPNTYGLNIGLETEQSFFYNKVINLAELGSKPFISLYMAPEKIATADGLDFYITLTDAYDPDNYINIRVCDTAEANTYGHYRAYISAAAPFQPFVGYEKTTGKIHTDTRWGFDQSFTFYGCNTIGQPDEGLITAHNSGGQLQLFFDLENKILLTQGNAAGNREITDFDNTKYYTKLWDGFTTGEVYLSLTAKTVYASKMNIVLTEIAGDKLTDTKLVDKTNPHIFIDTLGYENFPAAVVGQEYPVFNANSMDAYSGELSTKISIFRNYGSPSQTIVNIKDGKFIPIAPGYYDIVYNTVDYSGNEATKVLRVVCEREGYPIDLNVLTDEILDSCYVGEFVKFPNAKATGGNGNIEISKVVVDANGEEVEIFDDGFTPKNAGEYTVNFIAKDFVGTESCYSYKINVSLSDKPVFGVDPVFSKYFISGFEYVLPEYKAHDYTDSGKEVNVSIKITDDDGEKLLKEDRVALFNVANAGEEKFCTVTYEAVGKNGVAKKSYQVKVINAKKMIGANQRLDVSKYFYPFNSDVNVIAEESGIKLSANNDGKIEFINPLLASGFTLDFSMVSTTNLGAFKVTLEDSKNQNNRVELIFKKVDSQTTKCIVVGGLEYDIPTSFESGSFSLAYNELTKIISFATSNSLALKNANGTAFDGFESNKINLYFDFIDVVGESIVSVNRINAQNVASNVVLDKVSPRIAISNDQPNRSVVPGTVITVFPAIASDVISPFVSLSVTVTGADGKPLTSIDGELLSNVDANKEYHFKVDGIGVYKILYKSRDLQGNELQLPTIINCVDTVKPEIILLRDNHSTVKIGTKVIVAPVSTSDNYTNAENLFISCYVTRPTGTVFTLNLTDSNSFIANEVGTYIIRYMAFDEATNITIVENKLIVTD